MSGVVSGKAHRVVVLAYDQLWPLEFGIAVEIFGWSRPEILDVGWYDFAVAGPSAPIRSLGGMTLQPDHGYDIAAEADTIIIPAWRDASERPPEDMLDAVRVAAASGARLVAFCTGSFVLAHAGVLSRRRATTHWRNFSLMAQEFPDIQLVDDVLYVDDGDVITSAGSSAAVDCSLHIIRRDYGGEIANRIARSLVTPPHREGGQSQYIEAPYQERAGQSVAGVLDWAREHLHEPIDIADMADVAGMSGRTFLRRFREGTGTTPLKWLRRERVMRAMRLLEKTGIGLSDIADQCGFGSVETFRTAFRDIAGVAPFTYRKRFDPARVSEPEPRIS
ncbi:MAG: AraC family transcriptional regulator [Henriciella sp.]|mgnify:CR=1 FL=1|jgi:AraC family transcriptional activator FtrA|uniref:helix-turn-helix domain-containing protein n=1 Tax=Henriciella sp. TaxID=1968823 RepID=UPI000C0F7312|nr:helix-turn-helix domain-containing protein [Henriciella sp.]MAN75426.1 AraC family transcriptional regulator [Henriciella sp.]MBF34917.1 AraC family transcriptional regulator [Hyphomonadaceae bacterium]MBK76782.1 AraC family transcriptional regulator [Henriciella sp.]PHR74970.1 MAG: AraC family transcriptional regulator [Henriciella sp.]|tara:strand:+ start:1 stop:1002 length:1002 start_codon:yes stop_codon:yes gene_type:complete